MKLSQKELKLIQQFNARDTALVVSGYPSDSKSGKNYGIAWYTKETIEPMARKYGKRFVVLCEKNGDNRPKLKAGGKVLVLRIFDQERRHLYPQILTWLKKFPDAKEVYVHSEFGMKGGLWHFGLLLPFLMLIRLMGKRLTYYSHNVVDDIGSLSGHLNFQTGSLTHRGLNMALKWYYTLLSILCQAMVVLDPALKVRLAKFVKEEKIVVTHLPVEQKRLPITQAEAKKKLGIGKDKRVIVSFGFVTWYKGADWVVKEAKRSQRENVEFVLAGGPSYSLQSQGYYQKYYRKITEIAEVTERIRVTGFVQEADIPLYMAAADLVILPYRGLMGASGAMTHALSYGKPVMWSNRMKVLGNDNNFRQGVKTAGLDLNEVWFELSRKGMEKLVKVVTDDSKLKQLAKMARFMAGAHSMEAVIANDYHRMYAVDTDKRIEEKTKMNWGRQRLLWLKATGED